MAKRKDEKGANNNRSREEPAAIRNGLEKLAVQIGETRSQALKCAAAFEEKYYLIWGLELGLVLGILGNIFASHWIEFLRGLVANESWWIANVVGSSIALAGVMVFGFWMYWRLRKIQRTVTYSKEIVQLIEELEEKFGQLAPR